MNCSQSNRGRLMSAVLGMWILLYGCGGGGGGQTAVPPPPPPVKPLIVTFTAAQQVVPMGGSTTLSWGLDASVTSATLDGQSVSGVSGTRSATPRFRQSYTLVATDGKRTESKVIKVAAQGLDLVAGDLGGPGCLDGTGREARFTFPFFLAAGPQGNLVVAEPNWFNVRRVTPAGVVSSIAGNPVESGDVDGPAGSARFGQIAGLTVAPDGTVYVVDFGNQKIRKVAPDGTVSTLAAFGQGGAGGFRYTPALDASGNLYVSGYLDGKIYRISPAGVVSPFATGFTYPGDLAILPDGSVLVLESFDGTLWTLDGSGVRAPLAMAWASGDVGTGYISSLEALAMDPSGGLFLASARNGLLYRDSSGLVQTLMPWAGSQLADGLLFGLAWMGDRLALGVAKFGGEIMTLVPGHQPASLAGWAATIAMVDGAGADARFAKPRSLALGKPGEIYIADQDGTGTFAGVIRKIGPDGVVSTITKNPGWGYLNGTETHLLPLGDDSVLFTGGSTIGRVTTAGDVSTYLSGTTTSGITGICRDAAGTIYFGEGTGMYGQTRIRKLSTAGQVSTLADVSAGMRSIAGLSLDTSGRLLVADPLGQMVWGVSSNGSTNMLSGISITPGFQDGAFGIGRMREPRSIALHPSGRLLICDQGNRAIRILSSDGVLTTLGGSPDRPGVRLGPSNASFTDPSDMVLTPDGDLIITDGFAVLCWTAPFGE